MCTPTIPFDTLVTGMPRATFANLYLDFSLDPQASDCTASSTSWKSRFCLSDTNIWICAPSHPIKEEDGQILMTMRIHQRGSDHCTMRTLVTRMPLCTKNALCRKHFWRYLPEEFLVTNVRIVHRVRRLERPKGTNDKEKRPQKSGLGGPPDF